MNIQDEIQEIHHKFGVTEKANYKIQLFVEDLIKKDRAEQLRIGGVGVRSKQLPCKNEYAKEVIEDALYKTGRFSTDDCTEIMEGLIMYINDANLYFTEQGN